MRKAQRRGSRTHNARRSFPFRHPPYFPGRRPGHEYISTRVEVTWAPDQVRGSAMSKGWSGREAAGGAPGFIFSVRLANFSPHPPHFPGREPGPTNFSTRVGSAMGPDPSPGGDRCGVRVSNYGGVVQMRASYPVSPAAADRRITSLRRNAPGPPAPAAGFLLQPVGELGRLGGKHRYRW